MLQCNLGVLTTVLLCAAAYCAQMKSDPGFDALNADENAVEMALAVICPTGDILRTPNGKVAGCRRCPVGTDFQSIEGLEWTLQKATFGHFTAPDARNIILSGRGCGSHASYFGGSFMFVLQSGRPQLLAYNQALITERCQSLRFHDARDFLVCEDRSGGQGIGWAFIYIATFDQDGKTQATPLFITEDTVGTCGENDMGKPVGPVQSSSIQEVQYADLNGDGLPDISITATLGTRLLSERERKTCGHNLGNWERSEAPVPIATKKYQVDFLFDGKNFRPAAASKRVLRLFPRPEFPFLVPRSVPVPSS